MSRLQNRIALATSAFDRATRAWNRDDPSDNLWLMKLGEAMLFAALDLLAVQDDEIERLKAETSEEARFERLCILARQMTALGLEGEDPRDPRVAALLEEAAAACKSVEEIAEWIADRRTVRH